MVMLSVALNAECQISVHYAECRFPEYHYAECRGAQVVTHLFKLVTILIRP